MAASGQEPPINDCSRISDSGCPVCRRLPVERPLSTGAGVARYQLLGFILNAVSQPHHRDVLCLGVEVPEHPECPADMVPANIVTVGDRIAEP
jgi:hypothetical protein